MDKNSNLTNDFSHKKAHYLGIATIILIFGFFGVWAATAKIDTTVTAGGQVISKTYKKVVMHPRGGKVKKIYVKDGDYVKKDQVLLELDNSEIKSQLDGSKILYCQLLAQKSRIEAELNGRENIDFPIEKMKKICENYENIIEHEIALFRSRVANLKNRLTILNKKIKESKNKIDSLKRALKSKYELLNSYKDELKDWEELYKKGLAEKNIILDLKRKIYDTESNIEAINSQIQSLKDEIELTKEQLKLEKSNYKKELLENLSRIKSALPDLESKIAYLQSQYEKSFIRSPDEGYVTNMQIHAAGEVVPPNTPIMFIVPKIDQITIEAYVEPTDVDKIKVGQQAEINFPSYVDPSAKPVYGVVKYISADVVRPSADSKTTFYKILVDVTPDGMKAIKENGFEIIPGMPATVFIKAKKRTFLSYILIPLESLIKGAFHEN